MKVDLFLAIIVMVSFICSSIYATILGPEIIPLDTIIACDIMSLFVTFILSWFIVMTLQLRKYERIDWLNRMGLQESASLLERIPK